MCQLSPKRAFWVFCRERFYLNCYHDYRGQRAALGVMAINPISNSLSLLPQAPFPPNTSKIIPHSGTCKSRGLHDIMPTRHKGFLCGERTGMIRVRLAAVETSTKGGGRCWGEWRGGLVTLYSVFLCIASNKNVFFFVKSGNGVKSRDL